MPLYHIDDENRLFVHAGFSSPSGVEAEVNKNNLMHDRSLWERVLGIDIRSKQNPNLHPKRLKLYYEIYIGHTPTIRYNKYEPMNVLNVWNIDTGAAFTGKLSAVDIATKQVFQSDTLTFLYPNEFGRNK